MAKAAKKGSAKPAAKEAKAKPEKKAAASASAAAPAKKEATLKKEATPKEPKAEKPAKAAKAKETDGAPTEAPISKKEKAARAAAEKISSEELKKWTDLQEKHGAEKAQSYSMSQVFEANKPIQHKVLGWGFILNVQNDRLEVLFESGPKMLISNYKPR